MLVVDAFNVLHTTGVLPPDLAGLELADLVELIERSRYAGLAVTLVCDGVRPGAGHAGPGATRIGEARAIYVGGGREADAEIERLLATSSHARRMLVVSSDRRLRRAARRVGAKWIRSSTFLGQLVSDHGRRRREPIPKWVHEIPLGPEAVERWLAEFGLPSDWGPRVEPPPGEDARAESMRSEGPQRAERDASPESTEARPPILLDEATRALIEEHGIDPDELDMRRWV